MERTQWSLDTAEHHSLLLTLLSAPDSEEKLPTTAGSCPQCQRVHRQGKCRTELGSVTVRQGGYHVLEEQSFQSADSDQTHLLCAVWSRRCTGLQAWTATDSKPWLPRQCNLFPGHPVLAHQLKRRFWCLRVSLKLGVVSRSWILIRCDRSMGNWFTCWWYSSDLQIQELLEFSCVRPLRTVYTTLKEHDLPSLLEDPLMEVATAEVIAGDRPRLEVTLSLGALILWEVKDL